MAAERETAAVAKMTVGQAIACKVLSRADTLALVRFCSGREYRLGMSVKTAAKMITKNLKKAREDHIFAHWKEAKETAAVGFAYGGPLPPDMPQGVDPDYEDPIRYSLPRSPQECHLECIAVLKRLGYRLPEPGSTRIEMTDSELTALHIAGWKWSGEMFSEGEPRAFHLARMRFFENLILALHPFE